ncbi:MAG: prephenate dehydratase [Rhodobiaceae bacterium]|nr:prephenate dehydratase [Rhodobiaceae bacterium]MCC0051568.1 prephenate dehydratase [Rhodobiaceae bacterium]MCC0062129.1 prephenate dehydratase [Rhodobiaceae bacterium]
MSRPRRIAFQGEPGANSHIACHDVYPDHEAMACPTFEDAFQAVNTGTASLGMIPIENSVAGRVADIHHLLPESGLHIIGEYFLPVHYCLVAPKGATLETIKKVRSHPQALGQCRKRLRSHGFEAEIGADTAGSAHQVAKMNDPAYAALAPRLAAEVYGLEILGENWEDEEHNTTRFVVLSNEKAWVARGLGPVVTTFVFRVRNVPAALYKAMGGFATNGVNMTKLESYQLDGEFFATQFYADIEGHPDDRNVALALEELAFFSREFRILGVYRASPFREQVAAKVAARMATEPS